MAEDVKPETIKSTQDILGKFIKKPILTEKLLKKPPFRFLHDICTAAMKETGFFSDVINKPEDMIENIKDKEGKIAFLQKVIAAVEAANDSKLSVKPSKVVAGLEATKTNEFLQALGKALKKQVAENKTSKTKSTRSHSKETKQEQQDKKPAAGKVSKPVQNGVHDQYEEKKKKSNEGHGISPRKPKQSNKKIEENNSKPLEKKVVEKKIREKQVENVSQPEEPLQTIKDKDEEQTKLKINEAGESVDLPKLDDLTVNGIDGQGDQNVDEKQIMNEDDIKRKQTGRQKYRQSSIYNNGDQSSITDVPKESNEITKSAELKVQSPVDNKTNEKVTENTNFVNKSENALQEANKTSPSFAKRDSNLVRERTGLISRPRTGIRPTTARPASARPAAPRIKERNDVTTVEEPIKSSPGKINVIVDKDMENETEDDNLISLENVNDDLLDEITMPAVPITTGSQQEEHGHLVEQILEVQKELEDDSRLPVSEENIRGKTEIEWDTGRGLELAIREMEKLRSNIQILTRSANPLGKLLDFFQEDVDSIQRELESWKNKNTSLCIQIAHEKSITEQFIEPLKIHLKEIQQSIDEQFDHISHVKANIIRNNEKIQKLLIGV